LIGNDHDLNFQYRYDSTAGDGADVYVIGMFLSLMIQPTFTLPFPTDTGIFTEHPAFQGRASWGKTFGPYEDKDGNGHGTHCAGTAVSGPYGVAKAAHVIAVKVLSDQGSGSLSDV